MTDEQQRGRQEKPRSKDCDEPDWQIPDHTPRWLRSMLQAIMSQSWRIWGPFMLPMQMLLLVLFLLMLAVLVVSRP